MSIEVAEEPFTALAEYESIPIAFTVSSVLDVAEDGSLVERRLAAPYLKDYDAQPGEGPQSWPLHFDVSRWGLLVARGGGRRVGGAAMAYDAPGVHMLEGRRDLAVVWDLRVAPEARGRGVGRALWNAAEAWARARGCRELRVETQNVNVPACRFYARQGCVLATARHGVYPGLPHEVQLVWSKMLL